MNVFKFEFRTALKGTLIWTGSLCALVLFFLSVFPVFAAQAETTRGLFSGFPPEVLKALSLNLDMMFSLQGFYSFLFLYVSLCGSVQAMNLGITILTKEYRNKTADFLLSKPASRTRILAGKLLAVLCSLLLTNAVYMGLSLAIAYVFKGDSALDAGTFALISLSLLFLQLIFASLGVLLASVFHKIRSVVSVSLSAVFGFFILSMIQSLLEEDFVKYLTPFKYFEPSYIIANGRYDPWFSLTAAAVVVASLAASWAMYVRRDVHAV